MRERLAEMQACLIQQCGIAACGHPDMMARLIADTFEALSAQPEGSDNEKDFLEEVVALPASTTTAAAAELSQLSSTYILSA